MEYALPAGMFAGVLFFFWGISTMLSGGGAGSVEERMARYQFEDKTKWTTWEEFEKELFAEIEDE